MYDPNYHKSAYDMSEYFLVPTGSMIFFKKISQTTPGWEHSPLGVFMSYLHNISQRHYVPYLPLILCNSAQEFRHRQYQ